VIPSESVGSPSNEVSGAESSGADSEPSGADSESTAITPGDSSSDGDSLPGGGKGIMRDTKLVTINYLEVSTVD
jgi:hypothetical protein